MENSYSSALDECDLDVVSRPEIDIEQMEKGKDFIYTATVAVKPEVTLGDYKGIEIDKVEVEVTEEDVQAELLNVQKQNARNIPVEDRAAKMEDEVTIDFEGFIDGKAFEGGKGENYQILHWDPIPLLIPLRIRLSERISVRNLMSMLHSQRIIRQKIWQASRQYSNAN